MNPPTKVVTSPLSEFNSFIPLVSKPTARPNTSIHYAVYTRHRIPMPAGQLKFNGWQNLMMTFPDPVVVRAILGICQFGARIGYEGPEWLTGPPSMRT